MSKLRPPKKQKIVDENEVISDDQEERLDATHAKKRKNINRNRKMGIIKRELTLLLGE